MERLNSILIIYTGGTIGMIHEPASGALSPFNFDHILQQVPELQRFDLQIDTIAFSPLIDSSEITPGEWAKLADIIATRYNNYDGFVILHGTDTMAYSASALSFMICNLDKPVIFTGSQLPIGMLRTDGKENLITSIEIAAEYENARAKVPEVSIYFENKLLRGNRTTKINAEQFNAFDSPNYPALAEAGIDIVYNSNYILRPTVRKDLTITKSMSCDVALLKIYPGISGKMVESVLDTEGLKGLVLESFGAGNAPTDLKFLGPISNFCQKGGIALNISQCQKGSTKPGLYETGRALADAGVVNGNDMTTEAAITKLMYLMGNYESKNDVENLLKKSLRGEIAT